MITVDEINVGVARRSEQYCGAGGVAGGGVGGGIVFSEVSLDLDDAGSEGGVSGVTDEDFAQEFASYAARITGEEGAGEREEGYGCGICSFSICGGIYGDGHTVRMLFRPERGCSFYTPIPTA
jgi:hypothetical protein